MIGSDNKTYAVAEELEQSTYQSSNLSLKLLQGILDTSPNGIIVLNALRDKDGEIEDFTFTLVNERAAFAAASKPDELLYKRLYEEFPGLKETHLFGLFRGVLKDGNPASTEIYLEEKTGQKWYHIDVAKFQDGVIVNLADITEDKIKASIIEKQRRLYRRIFNTVPVGILNLRFLGHENIEILRINEAAINIFDIKETDLARLRFNGLFNNTAMRDISLQIAAAIDERKTADCDVIMGGKDGNKKFFTLIFTPLFDESDELDIVQCVVWDITQKKQAEQLIHQTHKIESVGQLAGGIAHDFNNRLTVITGNLELLEKKLSDQPDLLDLVREATASAFSSSVLTQQLLAFSRKQPLYPKIVNCNEQIKSLERMIQRTIGETIKLRCELEPGLWPVCVDPSQFDTAIVNFSLNARDAMPEGGSLTIKTENIWLNQQYTARFSGLTPGPYIRITIQDTGTGIDAEILPHVLDPFFTTKDVGKGSGLGLSTAYGFAKQSKGHLDIDSLEGEGTKIYLFLPRYDDEMKKKAPVRRVITGSDPFLRDNQIAKGDGETILIVEDDTQLRKIVTNMLAELNYNTIQVEDAIKALKILKKQQDNIDLVFADIMMPGGMTGLELAEKMVEMGSTIPVLLATGHASRRIGGDAMFSERFPILAKPYKFQDLAEAIHSLIGR